MSFDDYLDMYSALSEQATRDVKTAYAFRIYDFDGDGVIGREDIKLVVDRLLYDDDKHLTRSETTGVIDNLLKEVDNDEDGAICFPEFQQAMQKCPDFMCNFKMYLS
jgi:calcium and integrin-binding protein 1